MFCLGQKTKTRADGAGYCFSEKSRQLALFAALFLAVLLFGL